MKEIRFDDIDALQNEISEEFWDWGPTRIISQEDVNTFADITGDHQWIHIDVERCEKESPFGGPIVHGFFTLSLLAGLSSPSPFQLVGFGNATNYGADKLRFLNPVPCGSEVHIRRRLVKAEARKYGTLMVNESEIGIVGVERPALIYQGLTLFHPPQ